MLVDFFFPVYDDEGSFIRTSRMAFNFERIIYFEVNPISSRPKRPGVEGFLDERKRIHVSLKILGAAEILEFDLYYEAAFSFLEAVASIKLNQNAFAISKPLFSQLPSHEL